MFDKKPGCRSNWRASRLLVVATCLLGIACHGFLLSFIIPLLPFMLHERLGIEKGNVQGLTSGLLSIYALTSIIACPLIGAIVEKVPQRKGPLLAAIAGELGATIIVALAPNVPTLFIGRILQALSGSAGLIVGMATIADVVDQENLGGVIGLKSSLASIAFTAGPMISGWVTELAGYYTAWCFPASILVIDLIMRLLAKPTRISKGFSSVDNTPAPSDTEDYASSISSSNTSTTLKDDDGPIDEHRPLLSNPPPPNSVKEVKGIHFYILLCTVPRFVAAQFAYVIYAIIFSSFHATIPLHVMDIFSWGSGLAGLMFLVMEIPQMLLSGLFGWLRDRHGSRIPTTTAFVLLAPALVMLSLPSKEGGLFSVENGSTGKIVYVAAIGCCGVLFSLLNGVGQVESCLVIDELEARYPGVFGPNGGYARSFSFALMLRMMGMFVGPLFAGFLTSRFGYSVFCLTLGGMCFVTALTSFVFL